MYQSTKTFGHDFGLSCCFRQHRASSHCQFLHGYAIKVKLVFAAFDLDDRNWVIDFGSYGPIREWLKATFDHTTVVAADDPMLAWFREANACGILRLVVLENVGCEAFARLIFKRAANWLHDIGEAGRVSLVSVEVSEHEGNSAVAFNQFGTQVEF